MKRLSARFHVALGQTFLLISLIMVASYLRLIPDRVGAIREGHAALAEAIAANSSVSTLQPVRSPPARINSNLASRNPDILSVALRRAPMAKLSSRSAITSNIGVICPDEHSTDSQVQVPIWSGKARGGRIEFRYKTINGPGLVWLFTIRVST